MAPKKSPGGTSKKSKTKVSELETHGPALEVFGVKVDDIMQTPIGVEATVLGVRKGTLWVEFPGGVEAPLPAKATNQSEMEGYGYAKAPKSRLIQHRIDQRAGVVFREKYCGGPAPETAAIDLPRREGVEAPADFGTLHTISTGS